MELGVEVSYKTMNWYNILILVCYFLHSNTNTGVTTKAIHCLYCYLMSVL